MEFKHKSVLLDETVGGLNIKPDRPGKSVSRKQ